MIQRIQTFWLLLAAACAFTTFKFPYYTGPHPKGNPYALTGTENFPILLLTAAIGSLALIIIFLFRNRKLQLRLCVLGIVLEGLLIYLYFRETKNFTGGTYALTAMLHSLIVLFYILAGRGINKDEKLIKESDRLR